MIEAVPGVPSGLDPDVARWLEMAEAHAYLDAYAAAAELPGNPAGARTAIIGGAVAIALDTVDVGFFNRIIGLGVTRPAVEADVRATAAFYRDLGLTRSAIHVAPGALPAELPAWIAAAGYRLGGRWVKLWHGLVDVAVPAAGHRIERIGPSDAATFGDVCLAAFEMPEAVRLVATAPVGRRGWTHYVGYDGTAAVSTGALRIDGDVAWFGYGATLGSHRGRGWQTAMFLRRLGDARDAGCRLAVTETGEETQADPVNHSYRNMVRTGFRLAYARRDWPSTGT